MISGKLYDWLKWIAQIVLPALGALYFGLAQVWGLPGGPEVSGTILLVDTFLGILLGISTKVYNASDEKFDANLVLEVDPGGVAQHTLQLKMDENELLERDQFLVKVVEEPVAG